jgi:hypothetical protein
MSDMQVLQETGLGATRHRLELDLAHDRVERVTCTASLRFI